MEINACTLATINFPFAFLGKPSTEKKNHDFELTGDPLCVQSFIH